VTGNNGLGKHTIIQLAKHRPARIYLASRSESKGKDAIAEIQSIIGGEPADIRYLPLDLASFKSIRAAAAQVIAECDRLDTLILNAGVMALPAGKTEDGYEIQFGTNHIGHFLLTKLLLPLLQRTAAAATTDADVRIVSVSSTAWQAAPLPVSASLELMLSTPALLETPTWDRYAVSKAANIMFAAELARRYPEITSVSLHPGAIATNLYAPTEQMTLLVRGGFKILGALGPTQERGALTHLWAAGVEKWNITNGAYYTPVGEMSRSCPFVYDVEASKKLWEWTDEQVSGSTG
jgi:NAD(P)-dependent dehydrogenase (short-subunit alcohol dehydrogenase family)